MAKCFKFEECDDSVRDLNLISCKKEDWLSDEFGKRLEEIRKKVKEFHEAKQKISQPKWFTPHGDSHCEAVERLLHQLLPENLYLKITENERFFLLASAWLHDIGMLKGIFGEDDETARDEKIRDEHHLRSEKFLINNYPDVGIKESEKEAFGILARFHRRRCPLSDCPEEVFLPEHGTLHLKLLAAYLRLADALHVDQSRAPDAQYAISLAYDIPYKSKLHWLRSKFILGIRINVDDKEIIVHLKHPLDSELEPLENPENMRQTLEDIYDQIIKDIEAELNSVKDVLFAYNYSYFLSIQKEVHKVRFERRWMRDIKSVFGYYHLLDNPSSSSLYTLMLQAIQEIIDSYKTSETNEMALSEVKKFLDEIDKNVLRSRKCHTGLRSLVNEIQECLETRDIENLKNFICFRIWLLSQKRKGIRYSAYRYFKKEYSEIFFKILSQANSEKEPEINKVNILLYGYSELVIECLCGFRDFITKFIIENYSKEMNHIDNDSWDPLFGMGCQTEKGISENGSKNEEQKLLETCFSNTDVQKKIYEKFSNIINIKQVFNRDMSSKFINKIVSNLFSFFINNPLVFIEVGKETQGSILNKEKINNLSITAEIENKIKEIAQKMKSILKDICIEYKDNSDFKRIESFKDDEIFSWFLKRNETKIFLENLVFDGKIYSKFNEIEILKNSRKKEMKKENGINFHDINRIIPFIKKDIEKNASDYFQIFICEGQPKNRTSYGGRLMYHDGTEYALSLSKHGFSNIYIIPDATATSLIMPYFQTDEKFPKIDFVLVGTNGYDDDKFLHSSGHSMVSTITSFYYDLCAIKNQGCNLINKYRKNDKIDILPNKPPKLILALMTNKYKMVNKDNGIVKKTINDSFEDVEGWKFKNSFVSEPVRNNIFISQDQEKKRKLNISKICFYNPREDQIPIKLVNVVITEKACISMGKLVEENVNSQNPERIGKLITDQKFDLYNEEM